jgi:hypothetical protein
MADMTTTPNLFVTPQSSNNDMFGMGSSHSVPNR